MKRLQLCLLIQLLLSSLLVAANAADISTVQVQFDKGTTAANLKGRLKGYQIIDYQLHARAGQIIRIDLQTTNLSTYFNVVAEASEKASSTEAMFIGSRDGNQFEGKLPANGIYTIRVYLMRNAARRNEQADYMLKVSIKNASLANNNASSGFEQTLQLYGISFHISSSKDGPVNTLHIVPSGLERSNTPISVEIDGSVSGAEVADLNTDSAPEIYVYITSAGSGSYGSLVAYAANNNKSLTEIYLPPVAQDRDISEGYMGHDEFAVMENTLIRRFPIYKDTDTNAGPTGGTRQIQYKLVPGEAAWQLQVDKVLTY